MVPAALANLFHCWQQTLNNGCCCAVMQVRRLELHPWLWLCAISCLAISGCGTTKSYTATEQLLVSDAVDSTVSRIDFRPLSGRKVFLDNSFLPTQKGVPNPNPSLVHSEYVTSSIRQQMLAAGVLICEKREDADLIVEARLGALGFDGHTVTYGVPASNSLSTAASSLSGAPLIPILPELSFAKKESKSGAAKIALFAYERQTLTPVWQSGIARAASSARDTWVLGVGPLQYGTIYEGTRFAGSRVLGKSMNKLVPHEDDEPEALVDYKRSQVFTQLEGNNTQVETAGAPPATNAVTQTATPTPGTNAPAPAAQSSPGQSSAGQASISSANNGQAARPATGANGVSTAAGTTTPATANPVISASGSQPTAGPAPSASGASTPASGPPNGQQPAAPPVSPSGSSARHIDDLPRK